MIENLQITKLQKKIPISDIDTVPAIRLTNSWNGDVTDKIVTTLLAHTEREIIFGCKCPYKPYGMTDFSVGTYVEGLWNKDLVELFLLDQENNIYQELHIAPNGLWWAYTFDGIRQRANTFQKPKPPQVSLQYQETPISWSSIITIDKSSLPFPFEKISHGNVCACLGEFPRKFLSLALLDGEKPDFHQPSNFLPVKIT